MPEAKTKKNIWKFFCEYFDKIFGRKKNSDSEQYYTVIAHGFKYCNLSKDTIIAWIDEARLDEKAYCILNGARKQKISSFPEFKQKLSSAKLEAKPRKSREEILLEELNARKVELSSAKESLLEQQASQRRLEILLSERDSAINEKNLNIEDLTLRNNEMKNHLLSLNASINNISEENERLDIQKKDLQNTIDELTQNNEQLSSNLQECKLKITQLENDINVLNQINKEHQENIEHINMVLGDVISRKKVLTEKLRIETEEKNKAIDKAKKLLEGRSSFIMITLLVFVVIFIAVLVLVLKNT